MPGPAWRFLLFDMRTRTVVAELPAVDATVTFGEVLNAPGSAKVTIPIRPPDPVSVTAALLATPDAGFAVDNGGTLRWAGPVISQRYDLDQGTLELACEGIWSLVRRRVSRQNHRFDSTTASSAFGWVPAGDNGVGWRDANIGRFLLMVMQTYGSLGINTGSPITVGSFTELSTFAYERRYVADLIESNAATRGGYDFRFEPRWTTAETFEWVWLTSYPPVGRRTAIVWDTDGPDVDIRSVTVDSTNIAYTIHETGQGTGETMPITTVVDQALINAHLNLEAAESQSSVLEIATLERHAYRRLARGAAAVVTPTVDVDVSELGSFIVGDQVRVRADHGLLQFDDWFRVVGYDVDVSAGLIHVTVAPAVLFL